MKQVVITGVSGSLGSFLATDLLERGYKVVGISRTDPGIEGLAHVAHDLQTPLPANRANFGADWPVVNCAAVTRDGHSRQLEQANLAITQNALRLTYGPFVQISSSSVYDLTGPSVKVTEGQATGNYKFLNSYARSKFQTEQLVLEARPTEFVILRPHALIGPNDQTLGPRVRRAIRNGKLVLPGGGRAQHEFTSFANFSNAIRLSLEAMAGGAQPNRAINISNGIGTTIADAIASGLGADAPEVRSIPVGLAWNLARSAEAFTPAGREPRISRYQVAQLAFDRSYDLALARDLLGYLPEN